MAAQIAVKHTSAASHHGFRSHHVHTMAALCGPILTIRVYPSHCATKNSISYHIISLNKTFHWFLAPSSNWPDFSDFPVCEQVYTVLNTVLLFWTGTSTVTAENTLLVQEITVLGKTCASSALQAVLSKSWNLQFVCAHMQCFMYRVGRLNIYQIIFMQLWILLLMVVFLKYAVLHKLGVIPLF